MEELAQLCKYAQCQKLTRGEAVLCTVAKGKTFTYPLLKSGEVCVATHFYRTGHSNPDVDVDLEKIKECPYRRV